MSGGPILVVGECDCSGGKGITAACMAGEALGVAVIPVTACVVARTMEGRLTGVHAVPPRFIARQMDAARRAHPAACVVGMLARHQAVDAVAGRLARHGLRNVVLWPAAGLEDGRQLLTSRGVRQTVGRLFEVCEVLVCGPQTARALVGVFPSDKASVRRAVEGLMARGASSVVLTDIRFKEGPGKLAYGGDLRDQPEPVGGLDVGAVLTTAVAVGLASGRSAEESVSEAMTHLYQGGSKQERR